MFFYVDGDTFTATGLDSSSEQFRHRHPGQPHSSDAVRDRLTGRASDLTDEAPSLSDIKIAYNDFTGARPNQFNGFSFIGDVKATSRGPTNVDIAFNQFTDPLPPSHAAAVSGLCQWRIGRPSILVSPSEASSRSATEQATSRAERLQKKKKNETIPPLHELCPVGGETGPTPRPHKAAFELLEDRCLLTSPSRHPAVQVIECLAPDRCRSWRMEITLPP